MVVNVSGGKPSGIVAAMGTLNALARRSRSLFIHLSLSVGGAVS